MQKMKRINRPLPLLFLSIRLKRSPTIIAVREPIKKICIGKDDGEKLDRDDSGEQRVFGFLLGSNANIESIPCKKEYSLV